MRIFLSYSSKDRALAEPVYLALRAQHQAVFFDRSALPAGEEYDGRIREAIEDSDLFIFLVSPDSLHERSYTLTELAIAQKTWDSPAGRVLPVMLRRTELTDLPAYLRAVTVLEPEGNVAAAVADAVHRVAAARRWLRAKYLGGAVAAIAALAVGVHFFAPDLLGHLLRQERSEITGKDGAKALLVPGGKFVMGDDEWSPRREVYVDAFYMDKYEVSVALYDKFLRATGAHARPEYWSDVDLKAIDNLPVVGVSWSEAQAYCRWAGQRLPTEAEWEKAARGTDGRTYPWGQGEPTAALANFGNDASKPLPEGLAPVDSREAGKSPYGISNLAGNVAEWVADWYEDGFKKDDLYNPKGPDSGKGRVLRGGGWTDLPEALQTAKRYFVSPEDRAEDRGFRCVQEAPK